MKTLILVAASMLLVSCATPPATPNDEVAEQKTYRTGSHLPVCDKDSSSTVSTSVPPPVQARPAYIPGKGGGN